MFGLTFNYSLYFCTFTEQYHAPGNSQALFLHFTNKVNQEVIKEHSRTGNRSQVSHYGKSKPYPLS